MPMGCWPLRCLVSGARPVLGAGGEDGAAAIEPRECVASCAAGFLAITLPVLFMSATSSTLIVAALSLGYLVFLLKQGQTRRGRVVVISAWFALSLGGWLIDASLVTQILLQLSLIWIVRSLYFHASVLPALLDLGLVCLALVASAWAILQTGSVMTAIWCFFLAQSLFVLIPAFAGNRDDASCLSPVEADRFQSAHRVALDAVRKLSTH